MAKKESFHFTSCGGRPEIHAVKWSPENGESRAILQITHGMVEYIERYDAFATFLTENGFTVVGHDHVGHGDSIVDDEDLGYVGPDPSAIWVRDMQRLREKCEESGKPYFMLGHSMGSYLLRSYLAEHGEGLNGAIIMGTGYMPESTVKVANLVANVQGSILGWHHRSKLLQKLSYSKPYQRYNLDGTDPTNSWLTKDEAIVRKYYADPKCTYIFTCNAYKGLFDAVLYSCKTENIAKLPKSLPVFLVSGQDDPVGDLGVGVQKVNELYQAAGMTDVTMKLYANDRHEILNETDREQVYRDILAWMNERM